MSRPDVARRAEELRHERVPFVHARVVFAERPTSAKPGDEAVIYADGTIEGFVGGTCAESTVRAQGLALLDSGEPLLLRITPTHEAGSVPEGASAPTAVDHRLTVHNPCLSGGTLEIFMEPVVPAPLFWPSAWATKWPPARLARCRRPLTWPRAQPWWSRAMGATRRRRSWRH